MPPQPRVAIVGGGFTGLSAAYELAQAGYPPVVLEQANRIGGLAGSFQIGDTRLEKFYHHWFTNDEHVMGLVKDLGCEDEVEYRTTRTGMYYANNFFRLSTPLDVLRFSPLGFIDRIRLGMLVLRARAVSDWRALENDTAREWLINMCGQSVFEVVWEPLLRGKFGPYADEVSAVWFWNKLKLRGGSRSSDGGEMLAYYKGGFARLAQRMADAIKAKGGDIQTGTPATDLRVERNRITGVATPEGVIDADHVILTPALPIVADLVAPYVPSAYASQLRQIDYLANVCLVLQLDRSLSDTYWLNVNDPSFPFVGLIEHTNFEPPETYNGAHIAYLSKYLPATDPLYQASGPDELIGFCLPHLQEMFPDFRQSWIQDAHLWRARYAQPVVTRQYSRKVPDYEMPVDNLFLATMAQIYPEDRGTNYAIREGRRIAQLVLDRSPTPPSEKVQRSYSEAL